MYGSCLHPSGAGCRQDQISSMYYGHTSLDAAVYSQGGLV